MKKTDLKKFKKILEDQRDAITKRLDSRKASEFTVDVDEIKDEVDHASAEIGNTLSMKLIGREKILFDKVSHALLKIDEGEFGVCEDCDEEIEPKRLLARPVTTLCIGCKEEQEKAERSYG